MNPSLEQVTTSSNEEEDCLSALQLVSSSIFTMVLRTAIELDLLEIIAKAGKDALLSSSEIVSRLPTNNPDAPDLIDRMLRLLAAHSVLTCTLVTDRDGHAQRLYGLAPVCKCFIKDVDGISLAPGMLGSKAKMLWIAGVEHIGGDMFLNVPKGEVIFLKCVLQNWGDELCLKILKNCYNALTGSGKVIVVESAAPEFPDTSLVSKQNASSDMMMERRGRRKSWQLWPREPVLQLWNFCVGLTIFG